MLLNSILDALGNGGVGQILVQLANKGELKYEEIIVELTSRNPFLQCVTKRILIRFIITLHDCCVPNARQIEDLDKPLQILVEARDRKVIWRWIEIQDSLKRRLLDCYSSRNISTLAGEAVLDISTPSEL